MTLPLAGARVKASDLATIFPQGTDAWPAYVPTLTQGVVVTKTVEYAKYWKAGRWTTIQVSLGITSAGTAGQPVIIGMPTGFDTLNFRSIGSGELFDASAGLWYVGTAKRQGVGLMSIQASGVASVLGTSAFTAALAAGDVVDMVVTFEGTS